MPQRTHRLALVLAAVVAAGALFTRPAAGSGGCFVTLTISSAQEGVVASWTDSQGPWDVVLVAGVEYTFSVSCSCSPHDKFLSGDWDGEWGVWGTGAVISATYTFPLCTAGYSHTVFGECYGAGYASSNGIFDIVAPADLDIEGVDDEDEESAGAFVLRKLDDNAAPRRKIVLNEITPTWWDGHVLLSRNSDKVGVFDAETGGNEVAFNGADNRFQASALPRQLWVEGHARSDNLCDVGLTLALEGLPRTDDTVAFTVVESDLDIDSDNDNGTGAPERDSEEDGNEDKQGAPEHPGKYLALNDGDDDGDGIPDFADGFDLDGAAGTDDDGSAGEVFVPLVLELPQFVDPAGLTVSFTYPASDPAGVTCGGSPPVYTLPASGSLRIWLKDGSQARNKNSVADPGEPGDYVPSGTFDAPLLGYSAGTRTITLYVEAVHPGAIGADQRSAVEVTPQGEQAPWGPLGLDAVRCRGTRVQFVVPDAMDDDTGLPAPNAQPTDTTSLGVSDPRPIVVLDDIQPGDVSISGGIATVTLRGTVRDPIADNTPRGKVSEGKADIDSVKIIVNGYDDGTTVSVEAQADGAATFFRRHPYKGQFGPVAVTFPATRGTHTISIETSENAAGRTGSDDIEIRLTTREVPGAEGEGGEGGALLLPNIYIPQDPAPETADSIQYYYGDRGPAQDDPTLCEDAGDEASLVFHGTVEDVQAAITIAGFGGLTPNADTLSATVAYTWPTGEVLRFDVAFAETGAETKIFRGTLNLDPGPITVNQNVYVPVAPTPGTADTIRFFLGDRDPEDGDPAFSENPGEEDSLVFHGTYWGEPARITVTNFAGLTAAVDTLTAQVAVSPGAGNETSWQENLTETGAETNLFRVASVVEGGWNGGERAITAHYRVVIGQDFDPDAPDTVRFYIGEAEPPGGGTELAETGNGTKEFTATLADGAVVGVKVIQFAGLTPNVDDAVIRLTLTEPVHIPHAFEESYTETGAQTQTFNYTEPGDPDPPVSSPCVASVMNVNRKHGTFSQPMSVRVQGLSRTDGASGRLFDQRDFSLK